MKTNRELIGDPERAYDLAVKLLQENLGSDITSVLDRKDALNDLYDACWEVFSTWENEEE